MAVIVQQAYAEETVVAEVEGAHECRFLALDILHLLNGQREALTVVDGLHRFAIVVHRETREESGMGIHGGLDGAAQPLSVCRPVYYIYIRYIIAWLTRMVDAVGIDAILSPA